MTATQLRQEIDKIISCGYLISPGSESWYLVTIYNGKNLCISWDVDNGFSLSFVFPGEEATGEMPLDIKVPDEATLVSEVVKLLTKDNGFKSAGPLN